MRKAVELFALIELLALGWMTARALWGHHALSGRIATHFDMAGHADKWSSPAGLLILPLVGLAVYLLLTTLSFFPASFNYPVAVTDANRKQLHSLGIHLVTTLKAEVLFLFLWIQAASIASGRAGHGELSIAFLPLTGIIVLGTVLWFVFAMQHAAPR